MRFLNKKYKYSAYTLLELLIVMSIFLILAGMSFSAFDGLQNTIKMNEYMLNLEQDVRNVQRASMLLQRNIGEKWVYGLGMDFSEVSIDGEYKVFKWCSPYDDYGHISTKSNIPSFDPASPIGSNVSFGINATLPLEISPLSTCGSEVVDNRELRTLSGYERNMTLPKVSVVMGDAKYVLFESVSGRAFFYDSNGALLNYSPEGIMLDEVEDFSLEFTPLGAGSTRQLSVKNLSGKIETFMY